MNDVYVHVQNNLKMFFFEDEFLSPIYTCESERACACTGIHITYIIQLENSTCFKQVKVIQVQLADTKFLFYFYYIYIKKRPNLSIRFFDKTSYVHKYNLF